MLLFYLIYHKKTHFADREVGFCMAGGLGFEPRLTESESVVLPLDDPPRVYQRLEY